MYKYYEIQFGIISFGRPNNFSHIIIVKNSQKVNLFSVFIFPERCNLDCGPHGSCESGRCVCDPGWQGDVCTVKTCDPRCSAHGMCSNGTCLCTNGKLTQRVVQWL